MGRKRSGGLEHQVNACVARGETVAVFTGSDKTGIEFSRLGKNVTWSEGTWAKAILLDDGVRIFIEKWEHYWSGVSIYANGGFVRSVEVGKPL